VDQLKVTAPFGRSLPSEKPFLKGMLSPFWAVLLQSRPEGNSWRTCSSIIGQLKQERDRIEKQLSGLNAALRALAFISGGKPSRKRRKMSAKSRANIAAAQRARWAKVKAGRK
jgi:hypothetical protein